jgi:predicted DNA-binding transcriptional regulator AlpA
MEQQRVADSFAYPPPLMELERAAAYVGLGRTKFSEMVKAGHMPKPVDLDGLPLWDRVDLDRTVDGLKEIWREAKPRSVIDEALERRLSDLEPLFVCKACGHRGGEVLPLFDETQAPSRQARRS